MVSSLNLHWRMLLVCALVLCVADGFTSSHWTSVKSVRTLQEKSWSYPNPPAAALVPIEVTPEKVLSEPKPAEPEKEGQSVFSASMSLVKVMLGAGLLSLPSGLAAASNYPMGLGPAALGMSFVGFLSSYGFYLYGRLCYLTEATSLSELWGKCKSKETAWIIGAASFLFCLGACLSYSLVIGDFFSSLAQSAGLTGFLASRQASILGITLCAVLPLCSLQSLQSLAPVSMVGVLGVLGSIAFMAFRCPLLVAGSPYAAKGAFAATTRGAKLFSTYSRVLSPAPLILAGSSLVAYLAHCNAPDFYKALQAPGKKDGHRDLKKYTKVTTIAFTLVTWINYAAMALGFLTFGSKSSGMILNNYSTKDIGASISRALMGVSVVGAYPFICRACSTSLLQLLNKGKEVTNSMQRKASLGIVALCTALALVIKDAGFVIGLNGALMGSALSFIFPSVMFMSWRKKRWPLFPRTRTLSWKAENWFSRFLIVFGVAAGLTSGVGVVMQYYFPHLL